MPELSLSELNDLSDDSLADLSPALRAGL